MIKKTSRRLSPAADDEALFVEIYAECKHLLSTSVIPSEVFIQRGREENEYQRVQVSIFKHFVQQSALHSSVAS